MKDLIIQLWITAVLIIVLYVIFALIFIIINWDMHSINPKAWGWSEFRAGSLIALVVAVFATSQDGRNR
jgi:hypothetical protein